MAEEVHTGNVDISRDELEFIDELSALGRELWQKSTEVVARNTDPKMFSIMLYRRLWSHYRGYIVLWNNALRLEADIILRAAIESVICIAANLKLREGFVELMRQDAAQTLAGQIKIHRDNGATELVRDAEANLRMLLSTLPDGAKAKKLDWKLLAEEGGVPQLYEQHRMLSGVSSHVTGISILRGIADEDGIRKDGQLQAIERKMHLMMVVGATLQGSLIHARMIANAELAEAANELVGKLNELSVKWPADDPVQAR